MACRTSDPSPPGAGGSIEFEGPVSGHQKCVQCKAVHGYWSFDGRLTERHGQEVGTGRTIIGVPETPLTHPASIGLT